MKIYSNNALIIQTSENCVVVCNMMFPFSSIELIQSGYNFLFEKIKGISIKCKCLKIDQFERLDLDIVILLMLTELGFEFKYNNEKYELSFAYAVPLNRDAFLRDYAIQNLKQCLLNRQIVFLSSSSLYLCQLIRKESLRNICAHEKRTINKNSNINICTIPFSEAFFKFWENYDYLRFRGNQSSEFKAFFKDLFSRKQFVLREYNCAGRVIAYNVCYYSDSYNVIYDMLFPWKKEKDIYRIGIYSIIRNLELAEKIGWGYSLCYGQFPYKDSIFRFL